MIDHLPDSVTAVLEGFNPEQRLVVTRLIQEVFTELKIPERLEYRLASKRLLHVLYVIDEIMSRSRMPSRDWQQIALAFDLPSSRLLGLTEARIAARFGVCRMAVSKSITKVLRAAELKPNGRGFNGTIKSRANL